VILTVVQSRYRPELACVYRNVGWFPYQLILFQANMAGEDIDLFGL